MRFNERIQVDGEQIPDDALCALTEEVRAQADAMPDHPSEFELVTAIAMLWFLRSRCDIVVCEVGMGGEFDATNVIPAPEAAVFTNIGLDHMQYLGGTVEEISATKAGILKPGCDAVLYPSGAAAEDVIAARCRALGVPLHRVDFSSLRLTAASLQRQIFSFGERSMLRLPLLGGFQLRNAARRADGGGRAAWTRLEPFRSPPCARGLRACAGRGGSRLCGASRSSSWTAATIRSACRRWRKTCAPISQAARGSRC